MNKRKQFYGSILVPGLLALTLDQVTKFLAPSVTLNRDISFSWPLLPQTPILQTILLAVLLIGIALFARWHLRSQPHILMNVGYSVLLGAAFSNWLDRMIYSGVRDVWKVPFFGLHNNLADWLIATSVGAIIVIDLLLHIFPPKPSADVTP